MKYIAAVIFALVATAALAATDADKLSDPALEARARSLQKELRCLVCQGESLDESNAELARDLRRIIRERIAAGDTDQAIKDFLVARYGDFVLMRPPVKPGTYFLWFGPVLLLLVGGGAIAVTIFRRRGQNPGNP
jgi:cytochrome c-type biogenesis protein CcmH